MIADGDTEAGDGGRNREQRNQKPIDAEVPEVDRHRGDREDKGADQERTCRPVNPFEGEPRKHRIVSAPGARLFSPRNERVCNVDR